MRFLFVGSHLCARASSTQTLAGLPLPTASSYIRPKGHYRYSYRGLSPHQFMPMPGVHKRQIAELPLAMAERLRESIAIPLAILGR